MQTFPFRPASRLNSFVMVTFCVAAVIWPLGASAQPMPPQLETLEEGEPPAVTIRSAPADRQIIEKREQGKVTSVKVTSGNSTYELKPNTPAGSAQPGDAQSDATRPPQWKVMDFDWSRDQEKKDAAARAAATAAPLPPPALPDAAK